MKIEIRNNDTVHIEGYVNAVCRDSRVMIDDYGDPFVEQVAAGAFGESIKKNEPDVMINHNRIIKCTGKMIVEDNIGLYAALDVVDDEVAKLAARKELVGWSFGFVPIDGGSDWDNSVTPHRCVLNHIDVREISILDATKTPAYYGTSVTCRDSTDRATKYRTSDTDTVYTVPDDIDPQIAANQTKNELLKRRYPKWLT